MNDETIFTPRTIQKLEKLFEEGNTIDDACAIVGVSTDSYNNYLTDNQKFREKMERAHAYARQAHLNNIKIAGEKDWRASAWFLERTAPKSYGQKAIEPAEGKNGGKQINIQIVTGNGYVPPVRSVNVTSEGSIVPDTPEIQSSRMAQESPKNDNSDLRDSQTKPA